MSSRAEQRESEDDRQNWTLAAVVIVVVAAADVLHSLYSTLPPLFARSLTFHAASFPFLRSVTVINECFSLPPPHVRERSDSVFSAGRIMAKRSGHATLLCSKTVGWPPDMMSASGLGHGKADIIWEVA